MTSHKHMWNDFIYATETLSHIQMKNYSLTHTTKTLSHIQVKHSHTHNWNTLVHTTEMLSYTLMKHSHTHYWNALTHTTEMLSHKLLKDTLTHTTETLSYTLLKRTHTHYWNSVIYLLQRAHLHLDGGRGTVRITSFDFSSAFNTIQPLLLGKKLQMIGVNNTMISWITEYLKGRP